MISTYSRLLELAGRRALSLMEMSQGDAERIFAFHGVNPRDLDAAELKAAYRRLIIANHPDKGGDANAAKEINAAFDVLAGKSKASAGPRGAGPSQGGPTAPPRDHTKNRDGSPNFTRIEGIKAYFDENRQPGARMTTVAGFDGTFQRHMFTVPATPEQYPMLADAMVTWQTGGANPYRCFAVTVQTEATEPVVKVIWADGRDLNPPMEFEHDSFNMNWSNDQSLTRKLRGMIEDYLAKIA